MNIPKEAFWWNANKLDANKQTATIRSKQCPVCHADEGTPHLQECAQKRKEEEQEAREYGGMRIFSDWGE